MREIVNGKFGAPIGNAGLLFDATKLWKSLAVVGGAKSTTTVGLLSRKGQPEQTGNYSVTAPAIKLKDATIFDVERRA